MNEAHEVYKNAPLAGRQHYSRTSQASSQHFTAAVKLATYEDLLEGVQYDPFALMLLRDVPTFKYNISFYMVSCLKVLVHQTRLSRSSPKNHTFENPDTLKAETG